MRRRLFWLLLGWALGVLASNWMENRFRQTVNRYVRNTLSKLEFAPEGMLDKRSELIKRFRKRVTGREFDFGTKSAKNFNSPLNQQESYSRRQHRPVRPQKHN
ncbi:MAG: hypothetical protein L7S61_00410 [Acidimicrobiales bacterium]|nr:hypothetical protein [Acidimicrobiales bacterium]